MFCFGCLSPGERLCRNCRADLCSPSPRLVAPGLIVQAAYQHSGVARSLVHDLKYRGLASRAAVLGPPMAALLPDSATALIPVPRALNRRIRFGVDPALELSRVLSRITGLPTDRRLRAPAWRSHHAGKARDRRLPVRFSARPGCRPGSVIVDDVITTGGTISAARVALSDRVVGAVVATSAGVE